MSEENEFSEEIQNLMDTAFGAMVAALEDDTSPAMIFWVEAGEQKMRMANGTTLPEITDNMRIFAELTPRMSSCVLVYFGGPEEDGTAYAWAQGFERGKPQGFVLGQEFAKPKRSKVYKPTGDIFYRDECETIFE